MKLKLIHRVIVLLVFLSTNIVITTAAVCHITITIKNGSVIQVNENQTVLPVTFSMSGDPGPTDVVITATTHSDTAKNGSDYILSTKDITFPDASVKSMTIDFTILNDMKLENYIERFFINITTTDIAVCKPYDSVIIEIKDDDKVTIGFHREYKTVSENIGNVSMKFFKSINASTEITLTARYFTQGIGNATINTDYQNISKYITFTPLQYTNEKADAVAIIDNDIVEYTKCFNMSLDATHPNVMFSRQSMICILNDDKVTIEFRYYNMSVEEENGFISVPVIKTGKSAIPISVRMTMNENYNTAIKNVDYEDRHGTVITFPKDVSELIFNVTIKNDGIFESTESFFIGIEALDTSTTIIGKKNLAVIRIKDRIDNEIHQEQQKQIEAEQERRTVLMTYLLFVIMAVLIIMIIIFIVLIIMIIKKLRKYNKV